jgi:hypothetical protein
LTLTVNSALALRYKALRVHKVAQVHKDPQVQLVLLAHKAPKVTLEQQALKEQPAHKGFLVLQEQLVPKAHRVLLV